MFGIIYSRVSAPLTVRVRVRISEWVRVRLRMSVRRPEHCIAVVILTPMLDIIEIPALNKIRR